MSDHSGHNKPTAVELLAACPDVEPELAEQHLTRLDARYFATFDSAAISRHLRALNTLSRKHPAEVLVTHAAGNHVDVTVLAFDNPSVFSVLTGILTSLGVNVETGSVFTYRPAPPIQRQFGQRGKKGATTARQEMIRRRRIVDQFSGHCQLAVSPEDWDELLRDRITQTLALLENSNARSLADAKARTNQWVAARLEDLPPHTRSQNALMPIHIDIDNDRTTYTHLTVSSEDTPAFLYALSNALSLRGVSIEQVSIRTHDNRIEDDLEIADGAGGKIDDQAILDQIQLSVLLTKEFTYFLASAPDPYAALARFEHIVDDILKLPEHGQWIDLLSNPKILQDLARLLGASTFLWEDFVRQQYESLIPMLDADVSRRHFCTPPEDIPRHLRHIVAEAEGTDRKLRALNEFKDNEIYRIDLEHILNPDVDFRILSQRLTALAEAVVNAAAEVVFAHLAQRYGHPRTVAGLEAPYALLGLGKLGGAALGYASDIELLVVYSDNGATDGSEPITNAEFYNRFVRELSQGITAKRAGIFTIDLRLRPFGQDGPLGVSLESFCKYYGRCGSAHSYERLALVRLRTIGGDPDLGERVERIRDDIVYFSKSIKPRELRELRIKQFEQKTEPGRINAKFSPGALVDLEYDVQILQVMHGRKNEILRTPRVQEALRGLAESGVIGKDERQQLIDAYSFLRQLINGLRMLRGSAEDLFLPPVEADEFAHLARRMGYQRQGPLSTAQQLHLDFDTYTASIRAFVERHFGRDSLPGPAVGNVADLILAEHVPEELSHPVLESVGFQHPERAVLNLRRLAGKAEQKNVFARLAVLACDELRKNPDPDMALNNWERLTAALDNPLAHYTLLLSQPKRLDILLCIFAGSQFLADTLVSNPQFFDWITQPENIHTPRSARTLKGELRTRAEDAQDYADWINALRRYRRRDMLRIGTRDIFLHISADTVARELSELAEAITAVALEEVWKALKEESKQAPDVDLSEHFCIIAYGKLGGSELNYSSDIDLLGVYQLPENLPEDETHIAERVLRTAMERLRAALSSHTSEGYAYRVDLRLRPYGRSGRLVQSITALQTYYREAAAPWEIQALLKVRCIAGNPKVGGAFTKLAEQLLRKKHGMEEIVASIQHMRNAAIRTAELHVPTHSRDVKSGAGGIRDVEFLVQGLQLAHAEHHPDVLTGNTVDAIDALTALDVFPQEVAAQLRTDYLFLRRVEHCLQIYEDRQVHTLPAKDSRVLPLAKRILGPETTRETFLNEVNACMERVHATYEKYLLHAVNTQK
ncbi:MAG: glutamate-ammonia-ligase adenylyltransferase [Candidatus Pacebacteria bacterium]|nr:glutamate-ammonia-ligase adenylyltransferase [Candidatus Paceibacterota bacterium]